MESNTLIPVEVFEVHYKVAASFMSTLYELQIIEFTVIENKHYLPTEQLPYVEKLIRLHNDFQLDTHALSVAAHLLDKIEAMQSEMSTLRSRLRIYED